MRKALILAALVLVGCDLGMAPDLSFENRRALHTVPPFYAGWYESIEVCLGTRGDFDAVRWYVADEILNGDVVSAGVLVWPHDITMRTDAVRWGPAVRHEMVHHVTGVGDELHGTPLLEGCIPDGLEPVPWA